MQVVLGTVKSVDPSEDSFEFHCDGGKVKVSIVAPSVIRIQATRGQDYRVHESFTRVPYDGKLQEISFEETNTGWRMTSDTFVMDIASETFGLHLRDSDERFVVEDHPDSGITWSEDGFHCKMRLHKDTHFYGLGQKTHGLDKTGLSYEMWATDNVEHTPTSDPLYQSIPFFITLRDGIAHGIFFDNTYRTRFDFGKEERDTYSFGAPDGPLDYYIILGPLITDVIDRYTRLTGRPYFVPRWALGHQHSRWMTYESEEDVLNWAREFRNREIPCDTLVLDIDYMDEYKVFTWDKDVFPDPKAFCTKLRGMDFRVMTIIDPGVKLEEGYFMYDEGKDNDYFIKKADGSIFVGLVWPGETVFPEFSRREVREWFGSKYKLQAEVGVSASSWIDMNEPSECMYLGLREEYDIKRAVDSEGRPWEPRLRNVYARNMAEAVYKGLKEAYPGVRPFILSRSGFSGYQRYASMWTGDNRSTWEHLALSIPMLLNMGLSGVPVCGADIGGFSEDATPEILARWYEIGSLYPFCRNHSRTQTKRQEPWLFGDKVEEIARNYLSLRYQLLRYLYSLAWQSSKTGVPIMRPLVMEFQDDPETYTLDTQFMVGPFLMAAPVLEEGAESREVYFPQGQWYDFWTGERIEGGKRLTVDAHLEDMPLYVRAGAIIPTGRAITHTDEDQGDLVLWVCPGDGEFVMYEDDGVSDSGPSATKDLRVKSTDEKIVVSLSEYVGDWRPKGRSLIIELRGVRTRPSKIDVEGASIQGPVQYDQDNSKVRLDLGPDRSAVRLTVYL